MTPLLRPVTKMKCSMPASRASSTTIWISGRSTTGSISLGMALVAGRKRVPRPATGNTALRILDVMKGAVAGDAVEKEHLNRMQIMTEILVQFRTRCVALENNKTALPSGERLIQE